MKVSNVQDHITTLYKAGCRHTLFLNGPPGIGKSESAINAASELSEYYKEKDPKKEDVVGYRQWQATIEDPLELPGLPAVQGGQAVRVPFADKIPPTGRGLLIIDEINSAPPLTQCSLYSLVWDRKLGGSHLGEDWMIIATGNQDRDRAVTQRIPTPLVSRMEHITVEPDLDSWITWMAVGGGHDVVRAFMKHMGHLFVTFNPDVPGPFACPRTWKKVSDVMLAYGQKQPPFESISGWVGEAPAREFLMYYTQSIDLIDPDEIIKDPRKAFLPENPGQLYALTTALASRATHTNFSAILTYLDRMPIEYAVYCVASARDVERGRRIKMSEDDKKKNRMLRENKSFTDWCLKHHELIVE